MSQQCRHISVTVQPRLPSEASGARRRGPEEAVPLFPGEFRLRRYWVYP